MKKRAKREVGNRVRKFHLYINTNFYFDRHMDEFPPIWFIQYSFEIIEQHYKCYTNLACNVSQLSCLSNYILNYNSLCKILCQVNFLLFIIQTHMTYSQNMSIKVTESLPNK